MKKWLELVIPKKQKEHRHPHQIISGPPDPHTHNNIISNNRQPLPGPLAQKILEQQFVCESESIDNKEIIKLTSLYTEAVEYYQSIGSLQYKQYQKRMELFLQKGSVDEFLKGHSVELAKRRDLTQLSIKQSKIKSVGEANRLIEESHKKVLKSKSIINQNIADQEDSLTQRIRKRTTRSTTTSKTAAEEEQPELTFHKKIGVEAYSPFSIEDFLKRAI